MATNKTLKKAVCDKCGDVKSKYYVRSKHGYNAGDCGGTYLAQMILKEVLRGEFVFVRSYGKNVYLKHVETGREVHIFTVDLLNVLANRPIGSLVLTESYRGDQPCWKAQEVPADEA